MNSFFDKHFLLIAGPCVVESRRMVLDISERLCALARKHEIPLIFKASYRKANRSRLDSFTGIGDDVALEMLKEVREHHGVAVTTDVHSPEEALNAAEYVDVLQIPAFLCRQTDLLTAAASTGRMVNIKKGQFMSPSAMKHAVDKVRESGNNRVWLTERGTTFGYQDLVVDYRGIPEMKAIGVPVIMDCTHSLQRPNQEKGVTGGDPKYIETMARAALAVGADGLFIETHPNPSEALSDGANMLHLDKLDDMLTRLVSLSKTIRTFDSKPIES